MTLISPFRVNALNLLTILSNEGAERIISLSQVDFLREQAARAQELAEQSPLPNVRARYLESAETWMRLAHRAERLEQAQGLSKEGIGRSPRPL